MTLSLSCVQVFDHVWYYLPACRWHWCSFLGKGITIIQLTFYIIILCKLIYYPSPLSEVQTICNFFLTREKQFKVRTWRKKSMDSKSLIWHICVFFLLWRPYQIVFDNCIDYIFKVTKSVIEDFEQDNVKYLELRSTPRANPETGIGIQLNVRS